MTHPEKGITCNITRSQVPHVSAKVSLSHSYFAFRAEIAQQLQLLTIDRSNEVEDRPELCIITWELQARDNTSVIQQQWNKYLSQSVDVRYSRSGNFSQSSGVIFFAILIFV